MVSHDAYARDRHGRIIKDRYGRPVLQRKADSDSSNSANKGTAQNSAGSSANAQSSNAATPKPPVYRRSPANTPDSAQDNSTRMYPQQGSAQGYSAQEYSQDSAQHYANNSYGGHNYAAHDYSAQSYPDQNYAAPNYPPQYAAPHHTPAYHPPSPAHIPPTAPASRPPRRARPRRRFRLRRSIMLFLTICALLIGGTAWWVDTNIQRTDALADYPTRPDDTLSTNWLLIGSDSRAGLSKEDAHRLMAGELSNTVNHTDTIMVVHVPVFGSATMMSIPRDSWVNIPGHGMNKVNQAFVLGGPTLLQRTIEEATGIRIDRYAEIGFGGFANVVDALGSVHICAKETLNDPKAGINLQPGCQDMDGPTALGYVRSRYASANGDLDRVQRQREFLSAMSSKILSPGTLLNPLRAVPVVKTLTHALTVNEKDHVWNIARLAWAMSRGATQKTVPVSGYKDTHAGNVVLWDKAKAEELFKDMR